MRPDDGMKKIGDPRHVDVQINASHLRSIKWPAGALVGDGSAENVEVQSSSLPWSRPIGHVPLGEGIGDRIVRVRRLTRWVFLGLLPLMVALFVLGGISLFLSWSGDLQDGESWFLVFFGLAIILSPTSVIPGVIAVRSKTPRVVGGWLLLPGANAGAAREAARLNPPGTVEIR